MDSGLRDIGTCPNCACGNKTENTLTQLVIFFDLAVMNVLPVMVKIKVVFASMKAFFFYLEP